MFNVKMLKSIKFSVISLFFFLSSGKYFIGWKTMLHGLQSQALEQRHVEYRLPAVNYGHPLRLGGLVIIKNNSWKSKRY